MTRDHGRSGQEHKPSEIIQVPASPVKKREEPSQDAVPRRIQLGIDKGRKAENISLKRAPSSRGRYLKTSRSTRTLESPAPSRPLSFNERLVSLRTDEETNAKRQKRIQESRSRAFNLSEGDLNVEASPAVKGSDGGPSGTTPQEKTGDEAFDPYSGLHLSKRLVAPRAVARHVSGKKTMCIKEILREVKAPDFDLPDVEQDIVILGIVAKKSEPRSHNTSKATNGKKDDRGKYMVISLCDLHYEVDLFLFNSGFERFWKLTEGTVVAILNPNVLPPPPGKRDTGRFSLSVNSDEDTIIELGVSRDLGYCQSVKKDGNPCGAWVNKKRASYCEYHSNLAVQKTRSSRIELNTGGGFGHGPSGRGSGRGRGGIYIRRPN